MSTGVNTFSFGASAATAAASRLVLASGSPRRRAFLEGAGLKVRVCPVDVDEVAHPDEAALAFARRMATEKAAAGLRAAGPGDWVLAADTVVAQGRRILGKPRDAAEAVATLTSLSGGAHQVITSFAIHGPEGYTYLSESVTDVVFRGLSAAEIEAYVATGEPMDKAGAYGIQGGAGRFVEAVVGSYDGVVGLPLAEVYEALVTAGAIAQPVSEIAGRAAVVRGRVEAAAQAVGRRGSEVTVVAVSKRHPLPALEDAMAAGFLDLGESYVQEWREKAEALGARPRWHFVGRIQRNKAKVLGPRVDLVHGIDSPRVGAALAKAGVAAGRVVPVLVQVNVSGEAQKGGVAPDELEALLDTLSAMEGLRVDGLMTMPPDEGRFRARGYFATLRALRDALATEARPLSALSMGMSGDFEQAIAEGATLVRVGTSIFGARPAQTRQGT